MLRRSETVAARPESEEAPAGPARYDVEWGTTSTLDRRLPTDRRQSDRRGMDRLRAEALQAVISRVEDRNFGGLKDRMKWPRSLPLSRLVLIVVAVGAAACAAWLATQYEQPSPAQAAPVATMPIQATAPVTRILVAAQPIPVGQRLTAQSIQWQDWPDTALRPEFITASAEPDALTKMQDSVARVDFVAGDPILAQKLAPAGGGFLSSILDKGKRAVSVTVAAESASGGFVLPNDHVDVVLTRVSDLGQDSHTILSDVRVLAINTRLGNGPAGAQPDASQDPGSQAFADKAIATLELDPTQSEVIINATSLGRLSLVLRPTLDTPPASATADAPSDNERAANAAIRLSSPFWTK